MSVVARKRLVERVEVYIDRHPDATVPEVLGRFKFDPAKANDNEERALVEDVLNGDRDAPREAGTDEPGGVHA